MPEATIDKRFSDPAAEPTPWAEARKQLDEAKAYWFATVRRDGRPHVTTVAAVWVNDAIYMTTGVDEQKAKNLEQNTHCVITTGCSDLRGLDVVVEADAICETDPTRLQAIADAYRAKYDQLFPYEVRDGRLHLEQALGEVVAYRLRATKAFGFSKDPFSQTRWRFEG